LRWLSNVNLFICGFGPKLSKSATSISVALS